MSAQTATKGGSGRLREAMSCDVCSEVYEQAVRTPLVLPCGHTFCRACLTDIKKSGRFLCPKCRADHNRVQVEALTVNYSLLNILPYYSDSENDQCVTHGDDLRYWCITCDQPLCSICLYSGHPQGHSIKLAQTYVEEKKKQLTEKINAIFRNIEGHREKLKEGFSDLDTRLRQLFGRSSDLQDTEEALNDLLADTKKANDITSVLNFEKEVGEFQAKKKSLISVSDEGTENKDKLSGDTPAKEKNLSTGDEELPPVKAEDSKKEATTEAVKTRQPFQQRQFPDQSKFGFSFGNVNFSTLGDQNDKQPGQKAFHPAGPQQQSSIFGGNTTTSRSLFGSPNQYFGLTPEAPHDTIEEPEEASEVPRATIDYRDGRLLLHTMAEPAATRLSLQVPREVFLELSVGERCLGRVYITLWCHLRQAQQFLALCMGTMGPSFLGTRASEKVRNIIVFRSATDRNNQLISNNLMTGFEWGGRHIKKEADGLVTGIIENNGIAFGICTRGNPNAKVNAPFGTVVAGLEVAKEAFQHNPVNEVTITQCGLVLPGLAL